MKGLILFPSRCLFSVWHSKSLAGEAGFANFNVIVNMAVILYLPVMDGSTSDSVLIISGS